MFWNIEQYIFWLSQNGAKHNHVGISPISKRWLLLNIKNKRIAKNLSFWGILFKLSTHTNTWWSLNSISKFTAFSDSSCILWGREGKLLNNPWLVFLLLFQYKLPQEFFITVHSAVWRHKEQKFSLYVLNERHSEICN